MSEIQKSKTTKTKSNFKQTIINSYQIYNVKTKTHSWSDLHKEHPGWSFKA